MLCNFFTCVIFSPNIKNEQLNNDTNEECNSLPSSRDDGMKKTWPKTLGDRDRTKQYDSYVKPMSAEEKILLTQKAHSKTQKELNKAVIHLEKAITHYFRAHYGAKEVIGELDKTRIGIKDLQHEIKKLTMNALPYKDLNLEREQEKTFMLPLKAISIKTILYLCMIACNIFIYLTAFLFAVNWLYIIGIFMSIGLFLMWFVPWSKNNDKPLNSSKKVGPKY